MLLKFSQVYKKFLILFYNMSMTFITKNPKGIYRTIYLMIVYIKFCDTC